MGSSCYARGNNLNLEIIRKYAETNPLTVSMEVKGVLCTCICMKGPVIVINGVRCEKVSSDEVVPLLEKFLNR
jgi:NADH:ubiquinone oxidoreductase subunit E